MQLKLTAPHWLMAALALIATICPEVALAFPQLAGICAQLQSLTPLVLAALGVASGTGLGPSPGAGATVTVSAGPTVTTTTPAAPPAGHP